MTIGEKIQKLRKQHGLSQEALAEKVTVTRQTISKWELGQSTPDLDFIVRLSNIFRVSSDYLMREELSEPEELPGRKRSRRLSEKAKRIVLITVTAAALTAILVCLLCDYFTAERLTWSGIVAVSVTAAWTVLLPPLAAGKKVLLKTMLAVSMVPFPLLAVLAFLVGRPLVITMGSCIALVSAAALWSIYGIFRRCRKSLWRAFGFSFLIMIPVPLAILYIVARFVPGIRFDGTSAIFNSGITLILAFACFGADFLSRQRKGEEAGAE
ncbi:MAG TPA: helix-turn-helix domain-containing protein [Candidatus Eisenbergiella intestinipullorum]|nr:helix-turn-helix domain-containing protein [Candidatus Eisenbergiella intestinipullorum]